VVTYGLSFGKTRTGVELAKKFANKPIFFRSLKFCSILKMSLLSILSTPHPFAPVYAAYCIHCR
jgi:hypothetical protein